MKTVLYMNDKFGVWLCFEGDSCVDVHVDCLRVGQAAYQPCAWLESNRPLVHLLIDGAHAEIDTYPLQPIGTAMRQHSHRKALCKTLIDRFADAVIRTPAKTTGIDALLVQKLNLPEPSRKWLAYVEKSAITFCSVATSAETVASLFDSNDQPYLVLCNVLGYCKHTLCVSGHALFTRTIDNNQSYSLVVGLEETLSHLRTTELIDRPVRVHLLGLTDEQLVGACELEWVAQLVQCAESTPFALGAHTKLDDMALQHSAIFLIAKQVLKQKALRQHGSKRYVSLVLMKHLKSIKHQRNRLQFAALCALVVCSAGYSGSKQLNEQQRQNDYLQTKATLSAAIDNATQALRDESPVGIVLSEALLNAQALKSSAGPTPAYLMPIIATVFTEHRELVLQELSWVTIDNTDLQDAGLNHASTERITFRSRLPTESKAASKLLVNIVGDSTSTETLREQQRALNAVVSMLKSYRSISNLVVLEAPLANAANDDRIGADALDLATRFRIQFQVNRSLPYEA